MRKNEDQSDVLWWEDQVRTSISQALGTSVTKSMFTDFMRILKSTPSLSSSLELLASKYPNFASKMVSLKKALSKLGFEEDRAEMEVVGDMDNKELEDLLSLLASLADKGIIRNVNVMVISGEEEEEQDGDNVPAAQEDAYSDAANTLLHAKTRVHTQEVFLRQLKKKLADTEDPKKKAALQDKIRNEEEDLRKYKDILSSRQKEFQAVKSKGHSRHSQSPSMHASFEGMLIIDSLLALIDEKSTTGEKAKEQLSSIPSFKHLSDADWEKVGMMFKSLGATAVVFAPEVLKKFVEFSLLNKFPMTVKQAEKLKFSTSRYDSATLLDILDRAGVLDKVGSAYQFSDEFTQEALPLFKSLGIKAA